MKHLIVPSILMILFLALSLALMNISDNHPLDGSVGTQSIHVNAFRGMVSIRDNNVLSEWDGVLDYENMGKLRVVEAAEDHEQLSLRPTPCPSSPGSLLVALLVAKLFSKMACVLAEMDEAVFPTLDDIVKALDHQTSKHYPSTHGLTYTVLPSRVKNLAQFGAPIKDMCRAVPTYFAQQQKEGTALAIDPDSCFEIQLLSLLGLSICGEIPGL